MSGDAETERKRYFKTDAIGRTYEYDEHNNRIFKTLLHGSLQPPTIPLSEWQKLSKRNKQELHNKWIAISKALRIFLLRLECYTMTTTLQGCHACRQRSSTGSAMPKSYRTTTRHRTNCEARRGKDEHQGAGGNGDGLATYAAIPSQRRQGRSLG